MKWKVIGYVLLAASLSGASEDEATMKTAWEARSVWATKCASLMDIGRDGTQYPDEVIVDAMHMASVCSIITETFTHEINTVLYKQLLECQDIKVHKGLVRELLKTAEAHATTIRRDQIKFFLLLQETSGIKWNAPSGKWIVP